MNRFGKNAAWSVAAFVAVGLAVAAGSAVASVAGSVPHLAHLNPEDTPSGIEVSVPATIATATSPLPTAPAGCTSRANIALWAVPDDGPIYPRLQGEPTDRGAFPGAEGTVTLDPAGRVYSYTVAAGDAPTSIQERLCMDWVSIYHYNHVWGDNGKTIQPGDVLILRPDSSVVWENTY